MKLRQWAVALALTLMAVPAFGQEPAAAGRVKIASGSAFIVRAGTAVQAEAGQVVYQADTLRTGADGRHWHHAQG